MEGSAGSLTNFLITHSAASSCFPHVLRNPHPQLSCYCLPPGLGRRFGSVPALKQKTKRNSLCPNGVITGGHEFVVCFCWHAGTYRGQFKIPWHVREQENAFSPLTRLLLQAGLCLYHSIFVPPHGVGRKALCFPTPLFTQMHSPCVLLHQTSL